MNTDSFAQSRGGIDRDGVIVNDYPYVEVLLVVVDHESPGGVRGGDGILRTARKENYCTRKNENTPMLFHGNDLFFDD